MHKICCLLMVVCFLAACSGKEEPVVELPGNRLLIQSKVPLEKVFKVDGQHYFLKSSGFKFFLSDISYQNSDGEFRPLLDAFLFDAEMSVDTILSSLPNGAKAIRFGIGVPAGINTGDPTIWSNSHPYSIKGSKGMHWSWNTGYRFVVVEGRRDTVETGSFSAPFSFHTGTDSLYTIVTLPISESANALVLEIDPAKFFQGIDLKSEFETHTSGNPDLARRFTDNVKQSFSIRPADK